jgi:transposase, IS5 family
MTTKQMSFADLEIVQRLLPDTVLVKLNALINWEAFRPLLKGVYKRDLTQGGGQQPHDALMMFKATLLGQWRNRSDPALEAALRVRIDFIVFGGLDLATGMPDETTLCRFRNRLIATGKLPALLSAVNAQ